MEANFSRSLSLAILSIVKFLDRFGYYGMRGMIVLYAMDELEIDRSDVLSYYGTFTVLIYIMNLPMGILSDFLLKQKLGVLIGLFLLMTGYGLLIFPTIPFTLAGLIFICLGTGLVNPNMIVLVGRLYRKEDQTRNEGFVIFLLSINIAATLSVMISTLIAQNFGYKYGFLLCALASLLGFVLFLLTSGKFPLIESGRVSKPLAVSDQHPEILDYQTSVQPPPLKRKEVFRIERVLVLLLVMAAGALFWPLYEVAITQLMGRFLDSTDITIFGANIPYYSIRAVLDVAIFIMFGLFLIALWSNNKLKSSLVMIALAFMLLLAGIWVVHFTPSVLSSSATSLGCLLLISIFFSMADCFISAVGLSYITRLNYVQFSSTIVGVYLFGMAFVSQIFTFIGIDYEHFNLLLLSIIPIALVVLLLIGRKTLERFAEGIR